MSVCYNCASRAIGCHTRCEPYRREIDSKPDNYAQKRAEADVWAVMARHKAWCEKHKEGRSK